jgi:biotin carboxyl carrier protein
LAGKVVSIDVQIGQTVEEGAQVATIEAMKMNTYVNAPKAGRVTAISVKAGDSVEEGATLLVIG